MNKNTIDLLKGMIRACQPIIYIRDYDFDQIDKIVAASKSKRCKVEEWNHAFGYVDFETKRGKAEISLEQFLYTFVACKTETILLLKDVHKELTEEPKVRSLLQQIAQKRIYDDYHVTVIIASAVMSIPKELDKYISMLEIDLPTEKRIEELIEEHRSANEIKPLDEKTKRELINSLKGLSEFEINKILLLAISQNGTLDTRDKKLILEQKKQMVKKSGVIEIIDSIDSIDDVGGLRGLKEYLKQKATIIHRIGEAKDYGVVSPKGVFIVGMPGCGKSLCAKASAKLFEVPLLRLDIGKLMGKYVGESEENLRLAIRTAEAAHPCVLWVDEIEKAFAGIGGSGGGASDITMRLFGYFLTWLQEKEDTVYVIATANKVESLPPELKRKGRFDEVFYVDLPNDEERKDIFEKILGKKKRKNPKIDISGVDYLQLVRETKGYNGADIDSVINSAIEQCFLNNTVISTAILSQQIKATTSISESCKKDIEDMSKLFKENKFKNASERMK